MSRRGGGARSRGPVEGTYPVDTGEARLVREGAATWTLYVGGVPSSPVHTGDPTVLDFEYLRWMADVVDLLGDGGPLRAVHLGGGACALPRYVAATRPGSRQVVAEVDGALCVLVREWFDLPRSPALRLQVGDARERLAARPGGSADLVVRDVFAGSTTPRHVTTAGFVADVARVLVPGGVYLANVADSGALPELRAECVTVAAAFRHVALLADPGLLRRRRYANSVLVASREPLPLAAMQRRASGGAAPARLLDRRAVLDLAAGEPVRTDPPTPW